MNKMVDRSGFFTKGGVIYRQDVKIGWNYGFTRDAKLMYISELHKRLQEKGLTDIAEITTASGNQYRKLSPVFIPYDNVVSVEDQYQYIKDQLQLQGFLTPKGTFDYLYLISIGDSQRELLLSKKCFTDVFYCPTKAMGTQALTAAIYQYLNDTNQFNVLDNITRFIDWYNNECLPNIVVLK